MVCLILLLNTLLSVTPTTHPAFSIQYRLFVQVILLLDLLDSGVNNEDTASMSK